MSRCQSQALGDRPVPRGRIVGDHPAFHFRSPAQKSWQRLSKCFRSPTTLTHHLQAPGPGEEEENSPDPILTEGEMDRTQADWHRALQSRRFA